MKHKLFSVVLFTSSVLFSLYAGGKVSSTAGVTVTIGLAVIVLLFITLGELYPWKTFEVETFDSDGEKPSNVGCFTSTTAGGRSFVVHVHTCFSYDSLGKPHQLEIEALREGIDKIYTTDHENDLLAKVYPSDVICAGKEIDDPNYGRLLILGNGLKVIAHPNNPKYRFTGKYERDFLYELIDLKDVIRVAPLWVKFYFLLRALFIYPLSRRKALDYFPRLIPVDRWAEQYLKNTEGGTLKVIGGLDHHVKFTFWEKPKKFFSFPAYRDSFYILRNKTLGDKDDIDRAMEEGRFYISLCNTTLKIENERVETSHKKTLTVSYYSDGTKKVSFKGYFDPRAALVVVFRYSSRLGKLFFGVQPVAVFKPLGKLK